MNIPLQQLTPHLNKTLAPIYLLSGDEPLLLKEAYNQIIQKASIREFSDKIKFQVTKSFDWQKFTAQANNLSLFAAKIILVLNLTTGPGNSGSKILQEYASNPPLDKLLIVTTSKLDSNTKKSKWFKSIDKAGIVVQIWPLTPQQFPAWLQQKLASHNLTTDYDNIKLLAEFSSGNLLAAEQEIEKLSLLYGKGRLTTEQIQQAISNNSRFNIFTLVDSFLLNTKTQSLTILNNLRQQKIEPTLILWALSRELRLLSDGNTEYIPGFRKTILAKAKKHYSTTTIFTLLQQCAKIDRAIKGAEPGNVWQEFELLLTN